MLHPPRGVAASGFRPLCKIPHCCLPSESGPCLSSSVADHPLRPATDQSLGEPLPHQLANRARAPPSAPCGFHPCGSYAELAPLSRSYSPPKGRLPTCYAPVRRAPFRIATERALDLHVLSTPPAFVLSQDQTLV